MTYACAFCGEENDLDVDASGGRRQAFTEDCAVCCRPNRISLVIGEDGEAVIEVSQEYEA
ncbi:MAG TPA: CPXCG motif-containing cysteine-rich protein [Methylomirabilota bacterium]|nr:CPXCG motif-containing cysteine-rich protein [Methylomirabilota bacterium]